MDFEYMNDTSNFSPDGRLFQIEYALETVKMGPTVIAILNKSGIVVISEKKLASKLIEEKTFKNSIILNQFIWCYISGLTSDSRICVEKIRIFIENNHFLFNNIISVENCAKKVQSLVSSISIGENGEVNTNRPLGVAFLVFGIDRGGFHLFSIDPSGKSVKEKIASIGNGSEEAFSIVKEGYRENMSLIELKQLATKSLRVVIENPISEKNLEISTVDVFKINNLFNDVSGQT